MGLISSAKALWKKVKQKSQSSAQKAYTKKVQTERTQQRKHIVTSNYDKVRSRTTPTRTTTSRSSGGSSSYSRPSGTTSWSSRTTSSSSSTSPKSRQRKTSSSNTSGWSSYAQNTFKSSNKASQGKSSGTSVPRTASGAIDWGKINSKGYKGTASKALKEAYEQGKGINALGTKVETRKGGGVKSKDPTMEDFLKLQNASRNGNLKLDKKLAKKMGSRTAYAANRNSMARASHGFMQGMAFGDVESGPVKYNKAARKALKESRESTAGMVGYGVGQMAGFATGGTSGAAKSLASGGIKAGAKAAAKSGAKTTAKKFVRNRVTEMAVEAPLNAADAMKMSKDENGKVDVKKAAGLMALNTGLTGGTGALMEGAAIKFTKKNANRLIHLQSKANKNTITKKEGHELKALYDKLDNVRKDTARADSRIAGEGYRRGKTAAAEVANDKYVEAARNRMRNAKVENYVNKVKESNRQYNNDRELLRGNEDVIENGQFIDARGNEVPDTTKAPQGMKASGKQAKSSKKVIRQTLGGNHTPEAKAEIHDTVDRMSNMINHGDFEGARSEARKLARKHGTVQTEFRDVNHDMRSKLKDAQERIKSVTFRPSDDALKSVDSRGRIKDLKEAIGDYDFRKVHINKNQAVGKNQLEVDEVWDEWSKELPELFPPDVTDESARLRTIVEVSNMKPQDVDNVVGLDDEAIDEAYDLMARDIYDEAEKNAAAYKETGKKGASKPKAENVENPMGASAETVGASETPKKGASKPETPKGKVSQIKEFNDVDKAFKRSANNVLDNAPDRADDVAKLADEYRGAGSKIAEKKARIKNSDNPKHIEQFKKDIKALEDQQKEIQGRMTKLEDTHVSRHSSGKDVLDVIDPTDSKAVKAKKISKATNFYRTVKRLGVTSLAEFERVAKETGDKELMNAINNVYVGRNKVGAFIESARTSFKTRATTGKSLNDIFKDAGAFESRETRADFNTYALLRHHIDRADKGKPVFMKDGHALSIPDALKAMNELESKYGADKLAKFSDELTEYSNDLLKYRYDAGLITKETYENTLKEYPHYVPTYRIKDDAGGLIYDEAKNVELDSVIKAAKGGDAPIEDLYSQLHKITTDVITNAEQNEMIKLYAKDMGFDPKHLADNVDIEDLEKSRIKANKDGTISYFVNGERVTMKADKQAVKGLREWNGQDFAVFSNACAKIGQVSGIRIFKGLITDWNIAFGVRNGTRDIQQAVVNSKDTVWFTKSMPSALHAIANKNNAYRKLYEANGGRFFVPSGNPRVVKDPTKSSVFDKIISPIEKINGAIEMNPRMSEFIGTINKEADGILKKQGKTLEDLKDQAKRIIEKDKSIADADKVGAIEDKYAEMVCALVGKETVDRAMRNSADITLNFSRHGVIGKALNSGLVPYLNPSIQGLSKTIRLFTEGKADKTLLNIGMKLGTMTIAPAVFNEVLLADNRDYQDLNNRDKDNNFFIPLGDGKFIKLPKPRENAALTEPVTYGLRYFFDKAQIGSIAPGEYSSKENWKQMFDSVWDNIGPVNPITSNYFSPVLNTARNKTWYGGNIESVSDQELPVKDRRDETTSAWAIAFTDSKFMKEFRKSDFAKNNPLGSFAASNLSPKKVDNLMDSYFGMIYDTVIKPTAANRNLGKNKYLPSKENIGNYFMGQFVMDGVYSNKLAQSYYDKLDKLNKGAKEGERTLKASIYMNDYGYQAQDYSTARAAIFGKDKDFDKLTPKEKQEFSRYLKKHQNDIYRAGALTGEKDVCGTFENNFRSDPLRVMCRGLKKMGFEDKTGTMPEAKVLRSFTFTTADGKNSYADALDNFKESEQYKIDGRENGIKKFFNDTIRTRGLIGEAGGSRGFITWTGASLVAQERNLKSGDESHTAFAKAFGASDESLSDAKDYLGFYNLKDYTKTHKPLERMAMKEGKYLSDVDAVKQSIKLASKGDPDGAFFIEGEYVDMKQNPSRCIIADGMTSKEYNKWVDKYGLRSYSKEKQKGLEKLTSKSGNTYYKSSEEDVLNAIESDYGNRSNEFKAAMFEMFYPFSENPYGSVGDYSQENDVGLHHDSGYGGYGYGRRGYGGYGGGWGGGYGGYGGGYGSSAGGKDWNTYVGEIFDMKETKLHDYTKPSELTEAYRRRARKKQMVNQKRKG